MVHYEICGKETIVALATPVGRSGIAVIRVSGPDVLSISSTILKKQLKPRMASFSRFYDENDQTVDEGIALLFPAPHSFTGEDILELQCHGGPVVQDLLIKRILQLGARLAKPGEFSERAFHNGKIDLTQAEAIADLINAATEEAAKSAILSLQGKFSQNIHQLIDQIIHLRTYIEAAIDFPEEEIDFLSDTGISANLNNLLLQVEKIKKQAKQGTLLRDGLTVVIAGKTNAGKSSLLNAMSGRETAITSDIPGTTRDILREHIHIDGIPLHIIDTAGLRESQDVIEQEGIRRALLEIKQADIILLIMDASTEKEVTTIKEIWPHQPTTLPPREKIIVIRNKIDLLNEPPSLQEINEITISLSAKTQQGLPLLKEKIKSLAGWQQNTGEGTFIARRRHLEALLNANEHLLAAQERLIKRTGELLAEELRLAQQSLSEITGEFRSDDLLAKIFSSFCIGK